MGSARSGFSGRSIGLAELGLLAICATLVAGRTQAAPRAGAEALAPILSCRDVSDDHARLACFDKASAAIQEATAKRDIVVLNRGQIAATRKSLFGFRLPASDAVSREIETNEPDQDEITSTVHAAHQDGDGFWVVTLDNGAIWHQTGGVIGGDLRRGETATIKRAMFGSYFLRVGHRPGVKARREG